MLETATGLILRTRPLTETSLIVQWLTPAEGRLATVAKGARRHKSPFLGKLDLFYQAEFSFARSRRSGLHTLREVRLLETREALRQDLRRLQQAAYATALVEEATETDTPLPEIYELLRGFLDDLCRTEPGPQGVLAFELRLLRETGLQPDWRDARLAAGTQKAAAALMGDDRVAARRLKLTAAQTGELGRFLDGFILYHLGRLPRGRTAALAGTP
jgi:DNA repair protein RecO (recombination protein O)